MNRESGHLAFPLRDERLDAIDDIMLELQKPMTTSCSTSYCQLAKMLEKAQARSPPLSGPKRNKKALTLLSDKEYYQIQRELSILVGGEKLIMPHALTT